MKDLVVDTVKGYGSNKTCSKGRFPNKASSRLLSNKSFHCGWGKGVEGETALRGVSPLSLVRSKRVIQTVRVGDRVFLKYRSVWFYYASDSLGHVVDLGKRRLDLSEVVRYFERWREEYRNKYVHLVKYGEIERHIFIKTINRFEESYRRKLRRRMRKLRDFRFDLKIELTLAPKKFFTLKNEFDFLPRAWNKLRSWFFKRYGKFEFLRVLEIQKKGRPHLHILFSFYDNKVVSYFKSMNPHSYGGKRRFNEFYYALRDRWLSYGGGWVWVKPIKGNLKLVNYVFKYVNKTLNPSNLKDKVYSALLFASNKRLFSISKGFQVFSSGKSEKKGYEYLGCVLKGELEAFCLEKGVVLTEYVSLWVFTEDYYEYPTLFANGG